MYMLRCIRFYFKNPTKLLPIGKRLRSIGFLLDSLILQLLNIRCNLWLDQISMDFDFRISSLFILYSGNWGSRWYVFHLGKACCCRSQSLHHDIALTVGVFITMETYTYTYTTIPNWHRVIFQVCSNDSSDSRLFASLNKKSFSCLISSAIHACISTTLLWFSTLQPTY